MLRRFVLTALGCTCIVLLLWGFSLLKQRSDSLSSIKNLRNYAKILSNPTLKPDGSSMLGQPFMDFTLTEIGGEYIRLSNIHSLYKVLVLFDLDDCNSCLLEYRMWSEIARHFPSSEISVLGVCTTLEKGRISNFKSTRNITYPILWDPNRLISREMKFRTSPLRILLDKDNVIEEISLTLTTTDYQREYLTYLEKKVKTIN